MNSYISHTTGEYYEGDSIDYRDIQVTKRPSLYYVWNGGLWERDHEAWLDNEIRPKRDRLLDEVDVRYCNADKWETMTAEEKKAWRTYKQALRDLPTTIVYNNEVWPVMPRRQSL